MALQAPPVSLEIQAPNTYVPDVPYVVQVTLRDASNCIPRYIWNSSARLLVADQPYDIDLVNGRGSIAVALPADQETVPLSVQWNELVQQTDILIEDLANATKISGTISEGNAVWSGIIEVTGDVVIAAGSTLRIEPGTVVIMDSQPIRSGVLAPQLEVVGNLIVEGSQQQPVSFTSTSLAEAWGEIDVNGGNAVFSHTVITHAGNSPRGGHTGSGPAIRLRDSGMLEMQSSSVTDIYGKIMQASSGTAKFHDALMSRAVMGPEIQNTQLDLQETWIVDMAGRFHHNMTVDDNDGIYLHEQSDGQVIRLSGGVLAGAQDDGMDTLGSDISVSDFIVRDIADKGLSIFNGSVQLSEMLLVNTNIAINAKGSGANVIPVTVDHVTIANSRTGIRAEDKGSPDPDVLVEFDVQNSVIQADVPLETDYDPVNFHVNYSWFDHEWPYQGSGQGNLRQPVVFRSVSEHDFRLAEDSVGIDQGNPSSRVDPDGSLADMGFQFVPRKLLGDVNLDGVLDIRDVDRICQALSSPTGESWDLNQDGSFDDQDFKFLLTAVLESPVGDVNLDGKFDSSDLVAVFQAGQYEDATRMNSFWSTGDWNCDGEFTSSDLVIAFQDGGYQNS